MTNVRSILPVISVQFVISMTMQRKDNITAKNVVYVGGCGYSFIPNIHGHNHRIGGRDNFFHCDTCGLCLQLAIRDTHKCVVEASRSNCPVCMEVMREGIAKRCQVCFQLFRTCIAQGMQHMCQNVVIYCISKCYWFVLL